MRGQCFRGCAVVWWEEVLGGPGEDSGVCGAGCGGVVFGGDVEGEGEEGWAGREDVGGKADVVC